MQGLWFNYGVTKGRGFLAPSNSFEMSKTRIGEENKLEREEIGGCSSIVNCNPSTVAALFWMILVV